MFLFGEGREFLENLLEPAAALSIGMDGKRLGVDDLCISLIQSLQRSNLASQALHPIQDVGSIHTYSILSIGSGRYGAATNHDSDFRL
jgi:hypothetical protein